MIFKSASELENYILSKSRVAVEQAKLKVYNVIAKFLTKYYEEFNPAVYERTYQLLCSLVKTEVKSSNNGWYAEVYFDISALDYSTKLRAGSPVPNKGWSEEATLHEAMVGNTHGGYKNPSGGNTAIWTESLNILNATAINTLKSALKSSGIPVK